MLESRFTQQPRTVGQWQMTGNPTMSCGLKGHMPDALVADVDVESDDETDDLVQSSDDEMMFDDEYDMT